MISGRAADGDARPGPPGLAIAAAAIVLALVLSLVWAAPRPSGDVFMGLAGGRDVLQGKLGKPDDWSFATAGRVWLNQNWGFDAIMYAATKAGGEGGLLALKALTILAIAGAVFFAARTRGAGWPPALLVTAAAMAGTRHFMELRANMATYLIACLLLIVVYESSCRPHCVWIAVPLIAVWANLHGGFMLGFALVGLWLAANGLVTTWTHGVLAAIRRSAAPAGALAASVVLAVVLSPFGTTNLTYPFTYVNSPEWRDVTEWQRVSFAAGTGTASAWEFAAFVAFVVLMTAWRLITGRPVTESPRFAKGTPPEVLIFDAGLVVLMTWMGLSAIRFLPLAILLLTPLAASQASVLFGGARSGVVTAVAAAALAAALLPFASRVEATYSAGNPRYPDETFFQRMVGGDKMPSGAADFLEDNGAGGRVFNDWPWEGYLRWRCPQLRLFIGGRSNQIYTIDTLQAYRRFGSDPQPAATLARWDTHLAVVPLEHEWLQIVDRLAFRKGVPWAVVFYDGRSAVLADRSVSPTRELVDRVAAGGAVLRAKEVAPLCQALSRVSGGAAMDLTALTNLAAASRATPTAGGPWFLLFAARANGLPSLWVVHTLESEYEYLSAESGRSDGRLGRLQARLSIAQILVNLYGRAPRASHWADTQDELLPQLRVLLASP
ncbi:MAG: hypothetical protein ABR961_15150 [Thermoanaerobaculaceae bacterium]